MEETKSAVFFCREDIAEINEERLKELKKIALKAPLRRARICLHHNYTDKVQEMVIAFCKESYVRPHRHIGKSESFHAIEGEIVVIIFDEKGKVTRKIKMSPYGGSDTFLYRLSTSLWHTVIPLSEFAVIHEVASGPFIKEESDFPAWAPADNDKEGIKAFLSRVMCDSV